MLGKYDIWEAVVAIPGRLGGVHEDVEKMRLNKSLCKLAFSGDYKGYLYRVRGLPLRWFT